MLLIAYTNGIRAERQLCNEVHLNLAYRWFCRLGLEGAVPDPSTFSKNRYGRFRESDIHRVLFEEVVEQCREAGLVPGEGFAVDGSFVHGDARRDLRVESVDAIREEANTSTRWYENISMRSMPVIRFMRKEQNISRRLIPPPHGTPKKGAGDSATSPTT